MKRDERPEVTVRDTGKVITCYATECTCKEYVPMAVLVEGATRYVCRDCRSFWMNDLHTFRMEYNQ